MHSTVNEGRFQGEKEGQPRRGRRKHERVSGRKSSPERSAESWFTPRLAKPEIGKEVGKPSARRKSEMSQGDS